MFGPGTDTTLIFPRRVVSPLTGSGRRCCHPRQCRTRSRPPFSRSSGRNDRVELRASEDGTEGTEVAEANRSPSAFRGMRTLEDGMNWRRLVGVRILLGSRRRRGSAEAMMSRTSASVGAGRPMRLQTARPVAALGRSRDTHRQRWDCRRPRRQLGRRVARAAPLVRLAPAEPPMTEVRVTAIRVPPMDRMPREA